MKHLLAFFIPFILVVSLQAQVSEEIVVTASALPEPLADTPASVTVITRQEIERRAARDVVDVLREVPGLTVARIGSSGHQTSVFTRGANGAHTLVLWNGVEVSPPFFGGSSGFDWGQFSTAGVEQIEIVRGPFSALYGSEAMAGVINVLTVPARSGFRASAEAGGNGLRNAQLSGSHVTERLALTGSYGSSHDDGFAANDDFEQQTANVALRFTGAARFSVGVNARYTSYDVGIPLNLNFALDELVSSPLRRQDGNERGISIPIDQTLGRFSYEILAGESRREDLLDDPGDPFGPFFQTTDSVTRRGRLTTRTRTTMGTIVAGAEYESMSIDDVTSYGPNFLDKKRTERSAFIEDRYSRAFGGSRLELSAGARYDSYETFGSELSPRVAAAWIAGANKFRAAYGEAFRAPHVGEMFSPFGGNPDLRAERSRSFEAGVDRALGNAGLVSLTLFQDHYRDLITNAGFVLANVGRARSRGAELSLQARASASVNGGLTYTFTDAENLDTSQPLLRRPRHSGSAFVSVRQGITQLHVILLRTGERPDILPVLPFSRTTNEAHTTLDLNLQADLGRFTPYLKIENATGVDYQEVLGYPSPSRRAIVGVRFGM